MGFHQSDPNRQTIGNVKQPAYTCKRATIVDRNGATYILTFPWSFPAHGAHTVCRLYKNP